ncbi:Putative auxin efflux carrier component 5 [Striga hermonthica]|uniref:Auxin efflux carrier component n=1 Tax=Striga hermonthica TaxID=68872 RepID=A0A9N7RA23_STRHE|nr:Putative auxin efflux carrier component 5 [Striga hermonthica]
MFISLANIFHIITAIIPLYVAMIIAYISVKRWKIFTPDQCSGINKFVANFSIPLLSFQVISSNDPYKMNLKLVLADFSQKFIALFVLTLVAKISSKGSLSLVITGLSLSTLPNTLILGIPLVKAMYGEQAVVLLAQIVVLQSLVWYNLLLVLFEVNAIATNETEHGETTKSETKRKITSVLSTVAKKLMKNPNTYATLAGLIWASLHFRFAVKLPNVVENSTSLLSNGGLGMAMFSLGLFMGLQARLVACGTRKAVLAMAIKFVAGPFIMALPSIALGLRGTLLKVAIVQAALPQGIVPFVFAKEYNVHPEILSTGIIFGLIVAVPIGLAYYFLLALWAHLTRSRDFVHGNLRRAATGLLLQNPTSLQDLIFISGGPPGRVESSRSRNESGLHIWASSHLVPSPSDPYTLRLVNPGTTEYLDLPPLFGRRCFRLGPCLTYAAATNEYKVVQVQFSRGENGSVSYEYVVLTVETNNSWRHVGMVDRLTRETKTLLSISSPLITEGFTHWVPYSGGDTILTLDAKTEVMTESRVPVPLGHLGESEFLLWGGKNLMLVVKRLGSFFVVGRVGDESRDAGLEQDSYGRFGGGEVRRVYSGP